MIGSNISMLMPHLFGSSAGQINREAPPSQPMQNVNVSNPSMMDLATMMGQGQRPQGYFQQPNQDISGLFASRMAGLNNPNRFR